jgi:hypothetical protein
VLTPADSAPALRDSSSAFPGGRLMNAVSMTLLVVLRLYMVAVAGVIAFRAIGF